MKYFLCKPNLLDDNRVELTKSEYATILSAKTNLVHALEVESCFHVTIDNYLALETGMLTLASRHALFSSGPESDSFLGQIEMTRNLMNYLSSAKSYTDYLKRKANSLAGSEATMLSLVSPHTDNSFHYTLIEILRDYAQHQGVPVSGFTVNNKYEQGDMSGTISCSVAPTFLARDILSGRRKVDAAIKAKVTALKESFDLRPFIRGHFSCIRDIHESIRNHMASRCTLWMETMCTAIDRYKRSTGKSTTGDVIGLFIVSTDDIIYPQEHEQTAMFTGMVERRIILEERNQLHKDAAKRFASGIIRK